MSRSTKAFLLATLAAAVLTAAVLGADYVRDRQRAAALERDVGESRARWENIAEEKEGLQAELKTVTESLKEARLTIEESETRAAELQEEIRQLQEEIQALQSAGD